MTEEKQIVFVGLGNPGKKYEKTRHNLGFMVVMSFVKKSGHRLKEEDKFKSWVVRFKQGNVMIHVLLPMTFMNLSGTAVRNYLDFYRLSGRHLVVVNDDVALPFGEMRLRLMGSSGGHNGLRSIEGCLQTRHYARLRMGIGAVPVHEGVPIQELADYVLGTFSQDECKSLEQVIEGGARVLERLVVEDIHRVMTDINARGCCKARSSLPQDFEAKNPKKGQENKHE